MSEAGQKRPAYAGLDARPVPCRELPVTGSLRDFDPQALAWLRAHGVAIEDQGESILLCLPEGTTKQILYPFDTGERYRVRLPDGAECLYCHNPMHRRPHMLGVPMPSDEKARTR